MVYSIITELIKSGDYEAAISIIDNLLDRGKIDDSERAMLELFKLKIYIQTEAFDDIIDLAPEVYANRISTDIEQAGEALSYKAYALWRQNRIYDAYHDVQECEKIIEKLEFDPRLWIGRLYYLKGKIIFSFNEFSNAITSFDLATKYFHSIDAQTLLAQSYLKIGTIHRIKHNLDEALSYLKEALQLFIEQCDDINLAIAYSEVGNCYSAQGKLTLSYEFHKKCLKLEETNKNPTGIAYAYYNLGGVSTRNGHLESALEFLEKSLTIREEIGDLSGVASSYKMVADVYADKGELDIALEHHNKSLELREKLNAEGEIAQSLHDIGKIYHKLGNIEDAMSHYNRSLNVFLKIKNGIWASESLLNLILLHIELDDMKKVGVYMHQLESINNLLDSKLVDLRLKIAKAMVYKGKQRLESKIKALQIFEEISNDKIIDFRLSVLAMLSRCDLLLLEFQVIDNPVILDELNDILEQLMSISVGQQSYIIYTEVLILQSRVAILQLDLDNATELLSEALSLTKERNFHYLHERVDEEYQRVNNQIELWKNFYKKNLGHLERLKKTELITYLNNVVSFIHNL
jgi:tetratricopeptide (TPR) repeat protein